MSSNNDSDVGGAPAEGKITPEAIKAAENMIGMQLRPEGPYMQDATEDTMRNWCNGIGDLNPLYRDLEYGRLSRYGSIVAHPNFPMAFGWIGRTRWGLPGVHGFYAGNDWELFRHVRPGDRITAIERVVGIDVKESKFSGTLVMQYVEATFANQFGDVVAKALGTCTRHERKAARDGKPVVVVEGYLDVVASVMAGLPQQSPRRSRLAQLFPTWGVITATSKEARGSNPGNLATAHNISENGPSFRGANMSEQQRGSFGKRKAWIGAGIAAADRFAVGHGHGPIHHFQKYY